MTATALALPPLDRDARPGLARLTAVELRKMVDTRAGFWLLLTVGVVTLLAVALVAVFGDPADHDLESCLSVAVQPASVLLPVVGILLVTSEWSQRTGQITFTLVPQRARVLGAKLLAGVVLAAAALVVSLVVAAIAAAIAGDAPDGAWQLRPGILGQDAVYVVTAMAMGIGFGALFLSSAPAIVLSFVLPIAFSVLGAIPGVEPVAEWLDGSKTLSPLTDRALSATDWAQVVTTLALWMLLPLAIGLWRIVNREVR